MIEITSETIERVSLLLDSIPKGAERALSNSINRGLIRVKSGATKGIKETYKVNPAALNKVTNTIINKASTGNLVGYVSFSGYKIPLYKFSVSPKKPSTGKKVKASVKVGSGETEFSTAFIANMKNGHTGVFERVTRKRTPVSELMGLSAAQMVANEKIMDELEKEAQELVNARVEHEITRILNGYNV